MSSQFAKRKAERQESLLGLAVLPVSTLGKRPKVSYCRKNRVSSQPCLAEEDSLRDRMAGLSFLDVALTVSHPGKLPRSGPSILPAFPGHRDPPSAPESALLADQVAVASSLHKAQLLPAGRSIHLQAQ